MNNSLGGEVALFVDFENIRYSMTKLYGQEPDPQKLMTKALKYGRVSVANAYADFGRHPDALKRRFEVAGITRVDVPPKVRDDREQSRVDLFMLMDIVDTLLDRPQVETFVLMTGDSDFIRVAAKLKNRFGKTVIIAGVPGAVSNDLVQSASNADLVEVEEGLSDEVLRKELIRIAAYLETKWKQPTFRGIKQWVSDPRCKLGLSADKAHRLLDEMVQAGLFVRNIETAVVNGEPREITVTRLSREHPEVAAVVPPSVSFAAASAAPAAQATPPIPAVPAASAASAASPEAQ